MQVLHLFFRWLVDGLPSFCLQVAVESVGTSHYNNAFWSFFCLRLLTSKNQFVHTFLIDVNIIFCESFGQLIGVHIACTLLIWYSMYTANLIIWVAVGLYDVWSFWCFCIIFKYPADLLSTCQGFSLMVPTHNSTALKVNGMTEDIFIIISGPGEVIVDM